MTFQDYFPIWNKLQTDQQDRIRSNLNFRTVKKGTILHNGDMDCTGLLLVKAGQLRAYILSDEGREITIYRLFDRDLCLFSASCIMRSIQFEVTIQTTLILTHLVNKWQMKELQELGRCVWLLLRSRSKMNSWHKVLPVVVMKKLVYQS